MVEHINSKRLSSFANQSRFPLVVGFDSKCSMATMPHKHGGHEAKIKNRRKLNLKKETFVSQNMRGIKSDSRLEELFYAFSSKNVLAYCLQETWRFDNEFLENGQYRLVTSGLAKNEVTGNRGSQGVAIGLSQDGLTAWKTAGYELHNDFGARIIAIRLILKDIYKKNVSVFLVSAYASVGNAPDDIWTQYLDNLTTCIERRQKSDILIIGTDSNSSIGCAPEQTDGTIGMYGLDHVNESGKRFLSYLNINHLTVATTRFKKKQYATWIHPQSKKAHQIDHFIINKEMFHRCIDAGTTAQLVDSDHRAIFVKIRVMRRLKKKTNQRQRLLNLDYEKLREPQISNSLYDEILRNCVSDCTYTELSEVISKASSAINQCKKRSNEKGFSKKNSSKYSQS